MAVNPIERAVGRFLLGPVCWAIRVAAIVGLVFLGAYLIGVGFVYLALGEWLTLMLSLQPGTTTAGWSETATAWGLIGLGAWSIIVVGGRLFYNREIAHYRAWKKAEGGGGAAETNPETSSV